MKQLKILNLEDVTDEEEKTFTIRDTARAVIFDENNNIALMKVVRNGFYKIPGGGIDEGETVIEALHRECLEEAGVEIEILSELGCVKEVRKMYQKIQTELGYAKEVEEKYCKVQNSYCYAARVKGEKMNSQFTESEQADGFEVKWVPLDEAIKLVEQIRSPSIAGEYVRARELAILKAVKEFKENN